MTVSILAINAFLSFFIKKALLKSGISNSFIPDGKANPTLRSSPHTSKDNELRKLLIGGLNKP